MPCIEYVDVKKPIAISNLVLDILLNSEDSQFSKEVSNLNTGKKKTYKIEISKNKFKLSKNKKSVKTFNKNGAMK